jgi:hypothetical protein
MRKEIKQFYPVRRLLLLLLKVLKLRFLLKSEFQGKQLFSLVKEDFIYAFGVDNVFYCDRLFFNFLLALNLLKLPLVHIAKIIIIKNEKNIWGDRYESDTCRFRLRATP